MKQVSSDFFVRGGAGLTFGKNSGFYKKNCSLEQKNFAY
jgi:hypothetical protein